MAWAFCSDELHGLCHSSPPPSTPHPALLVPHMWDKQGGRAGGTTPLGNDTQKSREDASEPIIHQPGFLISVTTCFGNVEKNLCVFLGLPSKAQPRPSLISVRREVQQLMARQAGAVADTAGGEPALTCPKRRRIALCSLRDQSRKVGAEKP